VSPRQSADVAARTKRRIIRSAALRASRLGLEGVTVGDLAVELAMSKSGVVGPFGSRSELLSAALADAVAVFHDAVIAPLEDHPPGLARLHLLIDCWIDYLADCPFPGGCFITSASSELDGRPGPLRDQLAEVIGGWRRFLTGEITNGRGDLSDAEANRITLTLIGIAMATNEAVQLLRDRDAPTVGREAMYRAVNPR
jgi:AcrR family transcriptional regulator